ncbi:MAG: DNA polymerase IV [Clostridia bacterium]|nr:DNA polymerase IV [Clostridia bacterium]
MSERVILHCDLNNFYASVECLFRPELKNVPMAVCGSTQERHGIVLAKNEKAKKFGVKTAEAVWQAQMKCPELITVEPNFSRYMEYSSKVRAIYEQYTDLVEPFGMDECWLDVTGSVFLYGSGEKIAYEIKERIKKEIGLTISVGVSFNKVFAKLGSDLKKPDAVTVISKAEFKKIVWPLRAEEMIGVGPSTKRRLNSVGIYTLGDVASCDKNFLTLIFGKMGEELWKNASGFDFSPVLSKNQIPPAKSFGRSVTCCRDLISDEDVGNVMLYLTDKVATCLRENACLASVVQISVRDEILVTREKQLVLPQPSRIVEVLFSAGMKLFKESWTWESNVRSVGIRACGLVGESCNFQYNLFFDSKKYDKLERLESQIEKIRKKYGKDSVFRGSTMLIPVPQKETPAFFHNRM